MNQKVASALLDQYNDPATRDKAVEAAAKQNYTFLTQFELGKETAVGITGGPTSDSDGTIEPDALKTDTPTSPEADAANAKQKAAPKK